MCLVIWKMVSSAMTTSHNKNGLRTWVILDFVDQNVRWGTLHDILHQQQAGVSITFEIAVHDSPLKAAVWQVYDSIFSENQGKLAGGVRQSRRRYTAGNRLLLKPLSKYYGHTRMHDNIVPWALRAARHKKTLVTWFPVKPGSHNYNLPNYSR